MLTVVATILAIAIASNLDNAGVGIAYGVRKIHISWVANLMIAVISGVATYISGVIGDIVTRYVHPNLASWIGAVVVILVGVWVCLEPWREARRQKKSDDAIQKQNVMSRILRDPVVADFDSSKTIGLLEATVLGIALAMNALAGGFDAGVVHIDIFWTAFAVAVASYVLLGISAYLGRRFAAESLGNKATYIAGILLIIIGIHQVW